MGAAGLLLLGMVGCEEQIEEREIAKGIESMPDASERATPSAPTIGTERPTDAGDSSTPWIVPDGWEIDPQERPMRLATLVITDVPTGPVEVAVSQFPGQVGGVLANVNRWRGQTGLGPVSEDELPGLLTRFGSEAASGYLLRIDGGETTMLAAGVYEAAAERTWFVRVTTDYETADAVEEQVFDFAKSIATRLSGADG